MIQMLSRGTKSRSRDVILEHTHFETRMVDIEFEIKCKKNKAMHHFMPSIMLFLCMYLKLVKRMPLFMPFKLKDRR